MSVATANPETWAVGFLDECWWSRVALPTLSSWSEEGKPLRLVQKSVAKDDPEPKALSCYGLSMCQNSMRDVAEIRRRQARERYNDPIS